ncbi:alpha-glucan family phosphorylase [Planctomycetota bacterium]
MALKQLFVYPRYPDNLRKLFDLAYNLWCSWNYEAINLFYRIDARRFRHCNHSPVQLLLSLSPHRIEALSQDKGFLFELDRVWDKFEQYMNYRQPQEDNSEQALAQDDLVAYFSMEFGLHECIPIYGGGLGILAGDFLKAASDLNMPMVGVGLVYKYGYFTQRINLNGLQEEMFVEFDNHLVPMREIRNPEGQVVTIDMHIKGESLKIKLWHIEVGHTKLILLDTDIVENPDHLRNITHELYVSDREKRLQQELVVGLGGFYALRALDIRPKVYHINEGHSAFLVIARLQLLMGEQGFSKTEAKALIRASSVFTTHTPVVAGNEQFDSQLVRDYVEPEIASLDLSYENLAADSTVGGSQDLFWLPALAIRYSKYINAVSALHRDVSRHMWASLFPHRPLTEVPIDHVTNGVHSSWLSETFTGLLNRHLGPDYIHHACGMDMWDRIFDIPDETLWEAHQRNKHNLITFVRNKLMDDLAERGYTTARSVKLGRLLNPDYLTVVWARRFAPYKRPNLLLKDKDRLKALLTNPDRPIQLIFAGKAHPADNNGKGIIKEIIDFAKAHDLEDRMIFLENYDINVARHLAWGADVWLNTPIREYEASGTSGMKAAINGVLNLSVLDGWWPEVYNGKNGWAITAGEYYKHSELKEVAEAEQIYNLLEDEIASLYYARNELDIPEAWIQHMKQCLTTTWCFVNMNRVLVDYQNRFYRPAIKSTSLLCEKDFKELHVGAKTEKRLLRYWDKIRFVSFETDAHTQDHLEEQDTVEASCTVDLGQTPAKLVEVELYYSLDGDGTVKTLPMKPTEQHDNLAHYQCTFTITGHGRQGLNARIKPANPMVQDLHPEMIKWAQ